MHNAMLELSCKFNVLRVLVSLLSPSGTQCVCSSNAGGETAALQDEFDFKLDSNRFPETVLACLRPGGPLLRPKERR